MNPNRIPIEDLILEIDYLRADLEKRDAEIERLKGALRRITDVPPGTVTTAYDMRHIAQTALAGEDK